MTKQEAIDLINKRNASHLDGHMLVVRSLDGEISNRAGNLCSESPNI